MSRIKITLSIILILLSFFSPAQKLTLSGTIRDKDTGEELTGATVVVKNVGNYGTSSNEYGFYSLSLPKGEYVLRCSFVGYKEQILSINLEKTQKINWQLISGEELQEVVVTASRQNDNILKPVMGINRLDIKEISKIPVLFGEKDVLKTLQLLPGVKSAGEGNSGFYVRGGSSDQNLIILDEAIVYNASHLMGFFSTFNSDAIKDATLIKGNTPAQYGGRLASVLDVRMREGNDKTTNIEGGIGLISSRLCVESPIQKNKSSFIISGRRTYADLFLQATERFKDNSLYFYDLNTKANYRINENNRIFISGYFGRDKLGLGDQIGIDWGNKTGTLRWNSILGPRIFSNASIIFSNYSYKIKFNGNGNVFNIYSEIRDWNIKQEFQYLPNTSNSIRFGINSIYHTISPSRFESDNDSVATDLNKVSRFALENAVYFNNTFKAAPGFNIDYGLRLSIYTILGGDTYTIYKNGTPADRVVLAKGAVGKSYFNFEPRLSMNYQFNDRTSIKLAYSRNAQNLHLISNSTSASPTDQWVGSSYNIKPEIADQVAVGYFQNFADSKYEFSIETYYKAMQNQVDYKNGADINSVPDVESELLFGAGRAYGLEFFIRKRTGKFTGWISYTLSRTERQIEGINNNKWYAAKQDRTHDLALVGIYQLTQRWTLSSNFVFYTGNAVTFPSGKYIIGSNTILFYSERNGYRMPNYHRLDFSATYDGKQKGRIQSSWNFSIYNVYGRENAYIINFEEDPDDHSRTRAVQISLFRWIPSITYNFKL